MPRPPDPARAAARREAVTAAAARLFAERGYENTSVTDLARAAGLSSGSVFYHFPDKRAVFRSLFERDLPQCRELVERSLDTDDPLESILGMVDALGAEALDPTAPGIMVELLRQVDRDPELARIVSENASVLHHGFATLLRRAIESGTVDGGLDPDEAAAWIQAVIDAAFLNAENDTDPRPMLRLIVGRFLAAPTTGKAT
ncbi:TetR/AcrR family transcriptional regulator [Saccharomonospora piscinae]|uniref:TetR/AcrR family transcriptional regulator n=1 Tax=Saccharomonospora piscinae TaxID=687388 RepID=UPI001106BD7E|nr:TetR/AcrR family transcriptional regulator [Saccharomonospora piscinae]TLW93172.1 TetR/AcrR family transcriptional regulator [Saccharomonospora piscinae]